MTGKSLQLPAKETGKSVRQLLVLAVIMALGYTCIHTLRFAVSVLNQVFVYAYLMVPFLGIKPVRRLHQPFRTVGLVLLTPLLLLSSLELLGKLVLGAGGWAEHTRPSQAFQQGNSTIELGEYENGGAVGVHGIYLEQRRLIVPGLYMVKSIDFFDDARKATLSVDGPYQVRVHAEGNYYGDDFKVDKVYFLKPWVYF